MAALDRVVAEFREAFAAAGFEDPATEARILIGGLLGLERADFLSKGDLDVGASDLARLWSARDRRLAGEPPYRILGRRDFYGLDLMLSRGTLEPRPDTEILVDVVLERLAARRQHALTVLDLGTGTGAIILALLSELPQARGVAVDLSEDALATAALNAQRNGLAERLETRCGSWFEPLDGCVFDVIVSNPPYIPSAVVPTLAVEVREHDPVLALDGGYDGLDAYRSIAEGAASHLAAGGLIAVETGFDQREQVETTFVAHGFFLAEARKDYGGNDRVQVFQRKY